MSSAAGASDGAHSNVVKIICPQCNGTGAPCARGYCDCQIKTVPCDCNERTFCEGKGWLWATRWEER